MMHSLRTLQQKAQIHATRQPDGLGWGCGSMGWGWYGNLIKYEDVKCKGPPKQTNPSLAGRHPFAIVEPRNRLFCAAEAPAGRNE